MSSIKKLLDTSEELAVGGLLLLLAVGTTFQVITRYFFGLTFDWLAEASRYLTILATFAGAGLAVKYSGHFTMEAVIHFLPERPTLFIKGMAHIFSAFIMIMVAVEACKLTAKLMKFGMSTASLGIPMWVAYSPILIFSLVIGWRFFWVGVGFLRDFLKPAASN